MKTNISSLLECADLIEGQSARLESIASFIASGGQMPPPPASGLSAERFLALVLAARVAGNEADLFFFLVCVCAEDHAERVRHTDSLLNELSGQMRTIEAREGLEKWKHFDPGDRATPAEWKELDARWTRRSEEVDRICDHALVAWLRRHGESAIAELYLNDRKSFDRRREAGRIAFNADPHRGEDAQPGSHPVT